MLWNCTGQEKFTCQDPFSDFPPPLPVQEADEMSLGVDEKSLGVDKFAVMTPLSSALFAEREKLAPRILPSRPSATLHQVILDVKSISDRLSVNKIC